jgi:hypothetical protein
VEVAETPKGAHVSPQACLATLAAVREAHAKALREDEQNEELIEFLGELVEKSDAASPDLRGSLQRRGRPDRPSPGTDEELDCGARVHRARYCAQMFGCCAAGERETFAYGSEGTEQDCVDKARSHFYTTHVNGVSEAEQDGLLHYDAEKAGACLAQVTQDCSTVRLEPQKFTDQCEPYLLPQLENGAECTSFAFCKTGHCLGVVDDFEGTLGDQTGTCAEAQPGDECQSFGCGDDHYCDVDQDLGKFVCFALREDGADCRQPFECVSDYCGERDPNAGDFDGICAPTPQLCDGTE